MRETQIQTTYPAGMFLESLMAAECNGRMFELMGERVYSSLYKMMREEDVPKVESALETCRRFPGRLVEECVHVLTGESYATYIMEAHFLEDENKYYVELKNVAYSEKCLMETERENATARDLLTIAGGAYFSYLPESDVLRLFWMDFDQKIMLYDMPLAQWRDEMVEKGLIDKADEDVFRAFCHSVSKATDEQTYVFHGSVLSGGTVKEVYKVRFLTRMHGEEKIVEGVWMNINEQTGDVVDDYLCGSKLDSLTRILNKTSVSQYAEKAVDDGENPAIIMIDIDNFKSINDTYGHPFGDRAVAAVADIIKRVVGRQGVAGRVGGDEFMVVLKRYGDEVGLRSYLRGIRTNVAALFPEELGGSKMSCSIGVSRAGIDADNFDELYRIADKALYIAKQKGRNRYIIYKPELHGRFNTSDDIVDMKEIRESFFAEKDLDSFHLSMAEFVRGGMEKLPALLKQAADTLTSDRIVVFWGNGRESIAKFPPDEQLAGNHKEAFESKEYLELFKEDMLQVSNINMLEYTMPEQYQIYKSNNVRSILQHFLRGEDGSVMGFVSMERCDSMRGFPQLSQQLFKGMCRILNAVLLKEQEARRHENLDN